MRRAAALPMVLFSLGLVGALTVGGAFVSRRFVADARNDNRALDLGPAAEQAIVAALTSIDSGVLASHALGSTTAVAWQVTPKSVTNAWFTVLGPESVWVVAEATTTSKPLLHKRLGVIGRLVKADSGRWHNVTWFELP
jgi:hypothetical protein